MFPNAARLGWLVLGATVINLTTPTAAAGNGSDNDGNNRSGTVPCEQLCPAAPAWRLHGSGRYLRPYHPHRQAGTAHALVVVVTAGILGVYQKAITLPQKGVVESF